MPRAYGRQLACEYGLHGLAVSVRSGGAAQQQHLQSELKIAFE